MHPLLPATWRCAAQRPHLELQEPALQRQLQAQLVVAGAAARERAGQRRQQRLRVRAPLRPVRLEQLRGHLRAARLGSARPGYASVSWRSLMAAAGQRLRASRACVSARQRISGRLGQLRNRPASPKPAPRTTQTRAPPPSLHHACRMQGRSGCKPSTCDTREHPCTLLAWVSTCIQRYISTGTMFEAA